ncbi:MAG TPA: hypothetical protein VF549_16795 [Solirubrobacteraceae bacterium]
MPDRTTADPVSPLVQRLVAASGIFFAVFFLVTFLSLGDEPPNLQDDPVGDWTGWAKDNDTNLRIAMIAIALATYNFLLFIGYLRSVLGEAERAARGFVRGGYIILAAGTAGMVALGIAIGMVATSAQLTDASPDIIRSVNWMAGGPFIIGGASLGACLVTVGLLNAGLRALPAWLGWVALVDGIFFVLTLGSVLSDPGDDNVFTVFFPLSFLLLLIFSIGASVTFLRAPRPAATPRSAT